MSGDRCLVFRLNFIRRGHNPYATRVDESYCRESFGHGHRALRIRALTTVLAGRFSAGERAPGVRGLTIRHLHLRWSPSPAHPGDPLSVRGATSNSRQDFLGSGFRWWLPDVAGESCALDWSQFPCSWDGRVSARAVHGDTPPAEASTYTVNRSASPFMRNMPEVQVRQTGAQSQTQRRDRDDRPC